MKLGQIYADPEAVETIVESIAAEESRNEYLQFFDKNPSLLSVRLFGRTWELSSFGLCVVIAAVCGLLLLRLTARRAGLKKGTAGTLAMLLPPLGLIFAHAFYILASWGTYEEKLSCALHLWEGGYAMWGAILGFALAVLLTSAIAHEKPSALFDACAAPATLFVAVCRFFAYPFSGEGRGRPIMAESTLLSRYPFAVLEDGSWFVAVFLLESIFALIILHFMLVSDRKNGEKSRLFLILYGASQILCESMYGDSGKMVWHQFVRVPMLASAVVLALLFIAGIIRHTRASDPSRLPGHRTAELSLALVHSVTLIIGMEFAISKLPVWPIWIDYAVIADCCFVFGYTVYQASLLPVRPSLAASGQRMAEMLFLLVHGVALIIGASFVAAAFVKKEQLIFPAWACYAIIADGCLIAGYAVYRMAFHARNRKAKGA